MGAGAECCLVHGVSWASEMCRAKMGLAVLFFGREWLLAL